MKNEFIFDVHVLRHFFHDFCQLIDIHFSIILIFMEFSSSVSLTELLKIAGNSFEGGTDMTVFIFFQNFIVFVQSKHFFLFAEVSHFVIRDVFKIIEQWTIVIISDQRANRIIGAIKNEKGGERCCVIIVGYGQFIVILEELLKFFFESRGYFFGGVGSFAFLIKDLYYIEAGHCGNDTGQLINSILNEAVGCF